MTGIEIVGIAESRVGQGYSLGQLVPKNDGNWMGPWDCAEFASWCVFQVSGRLYGCRDDAGNPATADAFTGYWNRDGSLLGRLVSIEEASGTPGALLLRVPQANLTGHIVISDGRGGTVEAHSSKVGVVKSTVANRRWDMGILVPWIDYVVDRKPVVQPEVVYRLTTPMMQGAAVALIQQKLLEVGCNPGKVDGCFGPLTTTAVQALQLRLGLVSDGEVGPFTAAALGVLLSDR